jgi:Ca2+-binding RTX toxin-like protein
MGEGMTTTIPGTSGDDHLLGDADANVFQLQGGGADYASGGAGKDLFAMGASLGPDDTIIGGGGKDAVSFNTAFEVLTLTGAMLDGVETLVIEDGADSLIVLADDLVGAGAKLTIDARGLGSPSILDLDASAEGDGMLLVKGGYGDDLITTGDGADTVYGGKGMDIIDGGDGADRIYGGADRDVLTGGGGADIFVYLALTDSRRNTPDSIADLEQQDVIDVRQIDANVLKDGNQAFHLSAFWDNKPGTAIVFHSSFDDHWSLLLDVDGDARYDASIDLGITEFTPSNFLL